MKKSKIYIIVGILIILIACVLTYIMYINLNNKNNPSEQGQTTNDKIESKYAILNEYDDKNMYKNKYLITKNNDGTYKVVFDFKSIPNIIEIYNGKLYYLVDEYIKYIDLNNDSLKESIWLSLPKDFCNEDCGIINEKIINDTLYFESNSQSVNEEGKPNKYNGILILNMNAKSFNEHKKILDEGNMTWYIDNNYIYYFENKIIDRNTDPVTSNSIPYEYNIKTKETKKLFDVKYDENNDHIVLKYKNGKIIYAIYHGESFDCDLYLYDTNTKKSISLGKSTSRIPSHGLNLDSIADITDEKVYYRIDNTIYSYNLKDGTKNSYYFLNNLSSACPKDCYLNFEAINNNTLKITYNMNSDINPTPVQYVVDGKNVDSLDKVNIKMLDGNTKSFSIEDIELLND